MGRPSDYSVEIVTTICSRLAEGEPLVRMCREENMPSTATVYRWLIAHQEFRDMYARAREDQADTLADQIIDIADESSGDRASDGSVNSENVQRSRLRVEARKWIAAKLKPRKYGDRLELAGEVAHNYVARTPEVSLGTDKWTEQHAPKPH